MIRPAIVLSALLAFSGAASAAAFNVQHGYVFDGKYIKPSSSLKATYSATTVNASLYVDVARSVPTIIKTSLGTATVNVIDTLKANKPALVGVTKGFIKGGAVSVAGTLLADYLIQKGWEWMDSAHAYYKTVPAQACSVGTDCFQFESGTSDMNINPPAKGTTPENAIEDYKARFNSDSISGRYGWRISSIVKGSSGYIIYLKMGSSSYETHAYLNQISSGSVPSSKEKVSDSDINDAASDFVNTNPSGAIALNPVIDLDSDGSRSRIPPYALPPQTPTITRTTDAAGNVTTVTEVPHGVIEMPPVATVGAVPLTPTITQVIDTTTTVTKPDGTTTTTQTGTQTKPDDPPKAEEPELTTPGLAAIPRFYTSKGKTVQSVWSVYKARVSAAPVFSATGNFFKVNFGGSCPVWSATVYKNLTITIDQFCAPFASTLYSAAQAVLLVLASFFAFRVAVDN